MKIRLSIILLIMGVLAMACIGFFVFITTLSSPTSMELYMPKDTDKDQQQNKAKEYGALTILLGKDNHIYYYEGQLKEDASNFKQATFGSTVVVSPTGDSVAPIRTIVVRKKKAVIDAHLHDGDCPEIQQKAKARGNKNWQNDCLDKDLVVVIKAGDLSTYKNTVDILDEMTMSNIKRYAMVDPFPVEKEMIKKFNGNLGH